MTRTADTGTQASSPMPGLGSIHHISLTVTDLEASVAWYERVLGVQAVAEEFHQGGKAIILVEPRSGIGLGLHRHEGNPGEPFSETRTGLDHVAFSVATRADLEAWQRRLEGLGVPYSPIADVEEPLAYSVVVFRDPDNIELELIAFPPGLSE